MKHNGVKKIGIAIRYQVPGQIGFRSKNKWFKCEGMGFIFFTYILMNYLILDLPQYAAQWGQRILKLRSYFLNPHSMYHEIFSILSIPFSILSPKCNELFGWYFKYYFRKDFTPLYSSKMKGRVKYSYILCITVLFWHMMLAAFEIQSSMWAQIANCASYWYLGVWALSETRRN